MRRTIAKLSAGLVLLGAATSAVPAVASATDQLESAIALTSNRDNLDLAIQNLLRFEVYLMDADGANAHRQTYNTDADGLASLSPEGKKIAFDSNRNRADQSAICAQTRSSSRTSS